MTHVTYVDVASRDYPRWVDAGAVGALEGTRARARNVEDSNVAVGSAHEAVIQVACASVNPAIAPAGLRPSTVVVKVPWPEPVPAPGASNVVMVPSGARDEAMKHIAVVIVVSRDLPCRIDVIGEGALAKTRARARNIERRDGAVGSAHEAVDHAADTVVTRDCPAGLML